MLLSKKACRYSVVLLLLLTSGCERPGNGDPASEPAAVTNTSPLSSLDGRVRITAGYYVSASSPGTDWRSFRLCFGLQSDNNCLYANRYNSGCELTGGPSSMTMTCEWVIDNDEGDDPATKDHPFVKHPDDWDDPYILISSDESLNLWKLVIEHGQRALDKTGDDDFTSYTFVDKYFSSPVVYNRDDVIQLKDWISERRECVAKTAFCGLADSSNSRDYCASGSAACTAMGGGVSVNSIVLEDYVPHMVMEHIADIGQAGMAKFLYNAGSESGCTETFSYFAQQYSTGFHYDCANIGDCSYFPTWEFTGAKKFHEADRLYRIVFADQNGDVVAPGTDAPRKYIMGIYKCLDSSTISGLCMAWDWNDEYVPKPGDYIRRYDRWRERECSSDPKPSCCDDKGNGSHTMTLLNKIQPGKNQLIDDSNPFRAQIMESGVRASARNFKGFTTKAGTDGNVRCTADGSVYWVYDYLVGSVEHEKGGAKDSRAGGSFGFLNTISNIANYTMF